MGTFLVFGCNPTRNCALVGTFSYWAARELTPNTKNTCFLCWGHFPSLPPHANSKNLSIWTCFRCWPIFLDPNTQNTPHGHVLCVWRLLSPTPAEHKNMARVFVLSSSPFI